MPTFTRHVWCLGSAVQAVTRQGQVGLWVLQCGRTSCAIDPLQVVELDWLNVPQCIARNPSTLCPKTFDVIIGVLPALESQL